jgi:tRNA-binding protein
MPIDRYLTLAKRARKPMSDTISFDEFLKIDIRAGRVIDAQPFPEARKPAYKLWIDFGPEIGVKKTSAQITELYPLESLIGRQVMAVVNFPPRQIGPFMSEVLTLGVADGEGRVVLLAPDHEAPLGARMH